MLLRIILEIADNRKRCCVIVLHNFCYIVAVVYFSFNSAQFILFLHNWREKVFYTFIVLPLF